MYNLIIYFLKLFRKGYLRVLGNKLHIKPECDRNANNVSQTIFNLLESEKPCMIARFGANELSSLRNYIGIINPQRSIVKYIKGDSPPWWWEKSILEIMNSNAGFFPANGIAMTRFGELMLNDIKELDMLGSWMHYEIIFEKELLHAKKIKLMYLDPYWSQIPWTKALENKKILVVHPFAESIKKQYQKRELLFKNKDILPEFKSLAVIQAVQSLGKGDDRFNDWFDALEYMKEEINKVDFDICLIGCGAYGFPLAAHVKRIGKKAVHMGGSLQLLFGIRGKRWEINDPHYEQPENVFIDYFGLPNEHWIRPSEEEKPANHNKVEDSCYW